MNNVSFFENSSMLPIDWLENFILKNIGFILISFLTFRKYKTLKTPGAKICSQVLFMNDQKECVLWIETARDTSTFFKLVFKLVFIYNCYNIFIKILLKIKIVYYFIKF